MRRSHLLVLLLASVAGAQPLLTEPGRDMWDRLLLPAFGVLYGLQTPGNQVSFPGLLGEGTPHVFTFGKRSDGSQPWFSDLYLADQRLMADRAAGFWLSGLDFENRASTHPSAASSVSEEQNALAWDAALWLAPRSRRVLHGVSLAGGADFSATYLLHEDSIADAGWGRDASDRQFSLGNAALTVMLAGPARGNMRLHAALSGSFDELTHWTQLPGSSFAETHTGSRAQTLSTNLSVDYVVKPAERPSLLLLGLGIVIGTCDRWNYDGHDWSASSQADGQADTLGGFIEAIYSRTITFGTLDAFYGASGYFRSAFDYDPRSGHGIERYSNERRGDEGRLELPLTLRLRLRDKAALLAGWRPALTYVRRHAILADGNADRSQQTDLNLEQIALGVSVFPTPRVSLSMVPAFDGSVVMASAELRVGF